MAGGGRGHDLFGNLLDGVIAASEAADMLNLIKELNLDEGQFRKCGLLKHLKEAEIDRSVLKTMSQRDFKTFFSKYPIPFGLQILFVNRVKDWQSRNETII